MGTDDDPAADEDEAIPRASFLGLPAELRVQVYEYLFSSSEQAAQERTGDNYFVHCCQTRVHCCSFPYEKIKDEEDDAET